MTTPDLIPTPKQLNHLPIVAHALNRLGVRQVIDELVPKDPRSRVSTGECVEVLVTAILLGHHTLYRVADLLRPYDLRVAFGFDLADAAHFNDERLAKALTDVFHVAGVEADLLHALRQQPRRAAAARVAPAVSVRSGALSRHPLRCAVPRTQHGVVLEAAESGDIGDRHQHPKLRIELLDGLVEHRQRVRAALGRWRDGERDVTFPYGPYWMVHFHHAQCERAPPR